MNMENSAEEKVWYYAKPDGSKDDYIWMTEFENWINIGNSIYSYYLERTPADFAG